MARDRRYHPRGNNNNRNPRPGQFGNSRFGSGSSGNNWRSGSNNPQNAGASQIRSVNNGNANKEDTQLTIDELVRKIEGLPVDDQEVLLDIIDRGGEGSEENKDF